MKSNAWRILVSAMVVSEIKSQPSTEAVDGAAAVDVIRVDELAVRKVVIKVDAGVGVH